jgi:hypothetical protein
MARFYGKVGFGHTVEKRPGVMEDVITERRFYGDVLRPARSFDGSDKINRDVSATNRISIIADDNVAEDADAIRFVEWRGVLRYVTAVEDERPRLILSLGEVYNGPRAATPDSGD